jgi:hypothetical protein
MAEKATSTAVHIYLLDEGVDVWRPVDAILVRESVYQISSECAIPKTESWQFLPGDTVRCEEKRLSRGMCLAAMEKVDISNLRHQHGKS